MTSKKLEYVFEGSTRHSLKQGQLVMFAGDELTHIYFLVSGYVKMYNVNDAGEQRILLIFPKRHAFPIFPGIISRPHYKLQYFYETMSDVEALRIPLAKFSNIMEQDEDAARLVLDYVTELSGAVINRLGIIESKDANRKIMSLLPYLISICGSEVGPKLFRLELKITHQDIASLTGLTRETVSKEIKKLVHAGVVEQGRNGLIIATEKLPASGAIY